METWWQLFAYTSRRAKTFVQTWSLWKVDCLRRLACPKLMLLARVMGVESVLFRPKPGKIVQKVTFWAARFILRGPRPERSRCPGPSTMKGDHVDAVCGPGWLCCVKLSSKNIVFSLLVLFLMTLPGHISASSGPTVILKALLYDQLFMGSLSVCSFLMSDFRKISN